MDSSSAASELEPEMCERVRDQWTRCDSNIRDEGDSEGETPEAEEQLEEAEEEEEEDDIDEYGLGEKDRSDFCAAFTLLDTDGDGVISPRLMEDIVVALGREPVQENMEEIMAYCIAEGCDGKTGMDFAGFYEYLARQLVDTADETLLRESFQVFGNISRLDDPAPPGYLDMSEVRHYLKNYGLKLTDDEIDYLWEEENYWMLDDKRIEVDYMVKKILEDVTNADKSKFANIE